MQPMILVPFDFSEVTVNAAYQAARMADLLGGRLCLVHAVNHYTRAWLRDNNLDNDWVEEALLKMARELVKGKEIDVQTLHMSGTLYEVIPVAAREYGATMVAFSAYGEPGMQKLTPSKILRILASCPVPVMIFQRKLVRGLSPVLVPINLFRKWKEKARVIRYLSRVSGNGFIFVENHASEVFANELEKQRALMRSDLSGAGITPMFAPCRGEGSFYKEMKAYARTHNAGLILLISDEEEDGMPYKPGPWDEPIIFNKSNLPVLCMTTRMKLIGDKG